MKKLKTNVISTEVKRSGEIAFFGWLRKGSLHSRVRSVGMTGWGNSTPSVSGFTFIELLVSVTIMAVMMAVAIVSYSNTNLRSRDAKRKADLEMIRSALEICRSNTSSYPASITTNVTCSDATVTLKTTPTDPKPPAVYTYTWTSATEYSISANLELPTYPTVYTLYNP